MPKLTVVGLGPGREGLITREVWQLLKGKNHILLRTRIHPTVAALEKAGIVFSSYDAFYEEAESFDALYERIARDVVSKAQKEDVVYAVPGSPLVAERTVSLLQTYAREADQVEIAILPAMSFIEVLYAELLFDPVEGLTILDARDVRESLPSFVSGGYTHPVLITQVYDAFVASEVKLALTEKYGDDLPVVYIHHLALPDKSIRKMPIYALDRQKDIDHLTSLFIPFADRY